MAVLGVASGRESQPGPVTLRICPADDTRCVVRAEAGVGFREPPACWCLLPGAKGTGTVQASCGFLTGWHISQQQQSQGQEKGCGQEVAWPVPKGVSRAPPGASPSVWPNLGKAGSLSPAEGPQGPEKLVSTLVPSEQSRHSHGDLLKCPSVWRPRLCSTTAHMYTRTAHRWGREPGVRVCPARSQDTAQDTAALPGTGPSQHCSPAHLAF